MASASWQDALANLLSIRLLSFAFLLIGLALVAFLGWWLQCLVRANFWLNACPVRLKRDRLDTQVQATLARFPLLELDVAQRRYDEHVVRATHNFNVLREKELRRFQARFPRATAPTWLANSLPTPSFSHPRSVTAEAQGSPLPASPTDSSISTELHGTQIIERSKQQETHSAIHKPFHKQAVHSLHSQTLLEPSVESAAFQPTFWPATESDPVPTLLEPSVESAAFQPSSQQATESDPAQTVLEPSVESAASQQATESDPAQTVLEPSVESAASQQVKESDPAQTVLEPSVESAASQQVKESNQVQALEPTVESAAFQPSSQQATESNQVQTLLEPSVESAAFQPSSQQVKESNQVQTLLEPSVESAAFQPSSQQVKESNQVHSFHQQATYFASERQTERNSNDHSPDVWDTEHLESNETSNEGDHAPKGSVTKSDGASTLVLVSSDGTKHHTVTTSYDTTQLEQSQLRGVVNLPLKRLVIMTAAYDFVLKHKDRLDRPGQMQSVPPRWLALQIQARGDSDGSRCQLCAMDRPRPFADCVRVSGICGNCVWLEKSPCRMSVRHTAEPTTALGADGREATLPPSEQQHAPALGPITFDTKAKQANSAPPVVNVQEATSSLSPRNNAAAPSPAMLDTETERANGTPTAESQDVIPLPDNSIGEPASETVSITTTHCGIITLPRTDPNARRRWGATGWLAQAPVLRPLEENRCAARFIDEKPEQLPPNSNNGQWRNNKWFALLLQVKGEVQVKRCDACRGPDPLFRLCVKFPSAIGTGTCACCRWNQQKCETKEDAINQPPRGVKRNHPDSTKADNMPPRKAPRVKDDLGAANGSEPQTDDPFQRLRPSSESTNAFVRFQVADSEDGKDSSPEDDNPDTRSTEGGSKRPHATAERDTLVSRKRQKPNCPHATPGHCFLAGFKHWYGTDRAFRRFCAFMEEATESNNICVFMNVLMNPTAPVTRSIQRVKRKRELGKGKSEFEISFTCRNGYEGHNTWPKHIPLAWSHVAFWLQQEDEKGTSMAATLLNEWLVAPLSATRRCKQRYCSNPSHLRFRGVVSSDDLPENIMKTDSQIAIETFATLNHISDIFDVAQWREGMYTENELEADDELADLLVKKDFEIVSSSTGPGSGRRVITHLAEALTKADLVTPLSEIDDQFDTFVELYQHGVPFWLPRREGYTPPPPTP